MNYNRIILMGNLTRDVELRYTQGGRPVGNLGLAINRKWRTEGGEQKEETTFIDVTVFGRTAENCAQYLSKGRPVHVEGRLKLEQWEDRNTGQKRSRHVVVADSVQFLGRVEGNAPSAPSSSNPPTHDGGPPTDDDVPF